MRRFIVFFLLFGLYACSAKTKGDPVLRVEDDNEVMNAAMEKAQSTVDEFITVLKSPQSNQDDFAIKMLLKTGKEVEYIWVIPVMYDGKNFQGNLANNPTHDTPLKLGSQVTVPPDEIADWMYVEDGLLKGGLTLRVMLELCSPEEREFRMKSFPFRIE